MIEPSTVSITDRFAEKYWLYEIQIKISGHERISGAFRKSFLYAGFNIWEGEKKMSSEQTRNSEVIVTIRPEELMEELGIKKTAYYDDLDFLGIKLEKDGNGRVFMKEDEANLVRQLRSHVSKTGKRDGFKAEVTGAIATADPNAMASSAPVPESEDPCAGIDREVLYREASEVAACQMTMPQQVVLAMASQMTYEDLHPAAQAKVDSVRQAVAPKFQPQEIASKLLQQIRQQRTEAVA